MASGATTHTNGVRNGRTRSGSDRRSNSTAIDTMKKANSVPELEISASLPTAQKGYRRRHENAGDGGHDVWSFPLGVNVCQPLGQQAVTRHHEENAGLAIKHHQDDGWQGKTRRR